MNKRERIEHSHFFANCVVECYYNSKASSYYKVKYKEEVYTFCVSDHHGAYRGGLITIISRKRSNNKIKQIAFDIKKMYETA